MPVAGDLTGDGTPEDLVTAATHPEPGATYATTDVVATDGGMRRTIFHTPTTIDEIVRDPDETAWLESTRVTIETPSEAPARLVATTTHTWARGGGAPPIYVGTTTATYRWDPATARVVPVDADAACAIERIRAGGTVLEGLALAQVDLAYCRAEDGALALLVLDSRVGTDAPHPPGHAGHGASGLVVLLDCEGHAHVASARVAHGDVVTWDASGDAGRIERAVQSLATLPRTRTEPQGLARALVEPSGVPCPTTNPGTAR